MLANKVTQSTKAYLLTSSAFVFKPFPESPRHLNQNLNSSFLSSDTFLPFKEAPGMSFSESITIEVFELDAMFLNKA